MDKGERAHTAKREEKDTTKKKKKKNFNFGRRERERPARCPDIGKPNETKRFASKTSKGFLGKIPDAAPSAGRKERERERAFIYRLL